LEANRDDVAVGLPKVKGNIEGHPGATLVGTYLVGSVNIVLLNLKWLANSFANKALGFLLPEVKEGVNCVNDFVSAVWVAVKDLGATIYPHHGSAAVLDFAWNTKGNIVGNIDGMVAVVHCNGSDGKPVLYSKWSAVALPLWHAISCRSFKFMAAMAACYFLPLGVG
jgi:hypothetical protein